MNFPVPGPDLSAFAQSYDRLREQLGRDVRFYGPADVVYDPDLKPSEFDDEGIPLDPLKADVLASGAAQVSIRNLVVVGSGRANVLFQPLAAMRRDAVQEQEVAVRSRLNKDLILGINDRHQVDGASHFEIGTFARDKAGEVIRPEQWAADDGELWRIVNSKTDGVGGMQRFIVFGQGTL